MKPNNIFISHSRTDRTFVEQELIPLLQKHDMHPWYADREIIPSDQFEKEIRKGLNTCGWFLLVLSREAIQSSWVYNEVHWWASEAKQKRIIPVLLEDCDPGELHLALKTIHHIHWHEDPSTARKKLISVFLGKPAEIKPVDKIVQKLRELRKNPDTSAFKFICECLAHKDEGVRTRAIQVYQQFEHNALLTALEEAVRTSGTQNTEIIIKGLGSIKGDAKTIVCLERLSELLSGEMRNRVIALTERKRLSVQLDDIQNQFREYHERYEIVKVLGQGLFTASYLAHHKITGNRVVIRVLRQEFTFQDIIRTQFLDLAQRSTGYIHHLLALTRDVNQIPEKRLIYCVRDYIDGISLQNALDNGQAFIPEQVMEIIYQIALALQPIHCRNEVHGAVKPSNIFITGDHDIKLGDPSLPMSLIPSSLKRLSYDYQYTAPELFFDLAQDRQPGSDYYAMGCIAYELLCGSPPFVSDKPGELIQLHQTATVSPPSQKEANLLADIDEMVLWLLEKEPAKRPQSLSLFLNKLDGVRIRLHDDDQTIAKPVTLLNAEERRQASPLHTVISAKPDLDLQDTIVSAPRHKTPAPEPPPEPQPEPPPEPPDRISGKYGRYAMVKELGKGTMGVVYLAHDPHIDRMVALKVLRPDRVTSEAFVARFVKEARAIGRLSHANIVTVYDVGKDHGTIYIAMEYLQGDSLSAVIQKGRLTVPQSIAVARQVAEVLDYAHRQGIVHRDIKPSNIILDQNQKVKLTDFGIARIEDPSASDQTQAGELLGTPVYMAPEQVMGHPVDGRSDLFSLGVVLYEMVVGRRPFQGKTIAAIFMAITKESPQTPSAADDSIPKPLSDLILKCLSKKPEDRFQTGAELARALNNISEEKPRKGFLKFW